MVSKSLLLVGYFYFFSYGFLASGTRVQSLSNLNSDASPVTAIELPNRNADSSSVDSGCTFANAKKTEIHSVLAQEEVDDGFDEVEHEDFKVKPYVVLNLKHLSAGKEIMPMDSVLVSTAKDLNRIQTLHTRIVEMKKQKTVSRIMKDDVPVDTGLLGLGRGALSFSSQLQYLYGDSFSYCLVDRNINTSSQFILGEDKDLLSHPGLIFTTLVAGKENPVNTFYYLQIKSVMVGGEELNIPEETWNISSDGAGGTIIDSGTTLSYFADPAYKIIKEAFVKKVKGYPVVKDFPIMDPCYNVSGVDKLELPSLGFMFGDGAIWNFPVENYFIKLEPENVVCLAILGTPRSALSIIGNYQQQNFRILYDTKRSRLGFALTKCADI